MPDDLPDRLGVDEIRKAIRLALTRPSIGVVIFSWGLAIEKGKLQAVGKITKKVR